MPLRRLGRLARKVLDNRRETLGTGTTSFSQNNDGAMAALERDSEGVFAVLGAAVVSSWEVALTDLSRALRGRIDEAQRSDLIECMSDALVPTEQCFSGAGKRFSHAVKTGTRAALESGQLADAIAPLGEAVGVLGSAVSQGWPKTTTHMAPLFEVLADPESARDAFLSQGPRLQQALDDAWRNYMASLAQVAESSSLERSLLDALEAWKNDAVRAVETLIYEGREVLVRAAEALPERES